jgi:hypothetical protein
MIKNNNRGPGLHVLHHLGDLVLHGLRLNLNKKKRGGGGGGGGGAGRDVVLVCALSSKGIAAYFRILTHFHPQNP